MSRSDSCSDIATALEQVRRTLRTSIVEQTRRMSVPLTAPQLHAIEAGLTLRPSGLLLGAPSVKGTSTFTVTVTDAAGAKATGAFSLTVTDPPPPSPPGCQTGGR